MKRHVTEPALTLPSGGGVWVAPAPNEAAAISAPERGLRCHTEDYDDEDGPHSCVRPRGHDGRHECGCGYRWARALTAVKRLPPELDDYEYALRHMEG